MSDYDTDILVWSERQGAMLRRRAAGALVDDAELDWPNWRADAIDFRRQARRRLVPSMRQKIDLGSLHPDALAAMPETIDYQPPGQLPRVCEVTLDQLLSDEAFEMRRGPGAVI